MHKIIWTITAVALFLSYRKDKKRTLESIAKSLVSLKNLGPGLLGMIAFVGLILAAVPKDTIIHMFTYNGLWGFILASLIGAIVTIPGPIAFPLAGSLLSMGASPAALASFITTLTMVGLVSSPTEVSFFGLQFTAIRQTLSFLAAIAIGLILGIFL